MRVLNIEGRPLSLFIGVDPGASGAIAFIGHNGQLYEVHDMPAHEGIVSAPLCADILAAACDGHDDVEAWVESVHSMPRQGVASSFKFGRAFGAIEGVLGGARIPVHLVTPSKWKGHAGLSSDKAAARRRAIELFPQHSTLFARVKDDGRAEAALIALHGWKAGTR